MEQFPVSEHRLECQLTEDELKDAGKKLSSFSQQKDALEEEKSAVGKQFAAQIDNCKAQISKYSRLVATEKEMRSIKCRLHYNTPTSGKKTLFRTDTKEVVEVKDMTADECQDLFINALGEQDTDTGTIFVFHDRFSVDLVNAADDDFSADGWENLSESMTNPSLVFFGAEQKGECRVVKTCENNDPLYQYQRKTKGATK